MTGGLSEHQREALDRYYSLLKNHPQLFSNRLRRPIIREPQALETFAEEHQVVLGVAAETPYLWLINDLVRSEGNNSAALFHPYLRIIAPPQALTGPGVVVLATVREDGEESVVLVEQERHATGTKELELPRGFGQSAVSPDAQALRELQEETGYVGQRAERLGNTLTDSGTTDRSASFFHVPVTGRAVEAPEPQEAISQIVLLPRQELWTRIDSGAVRDAFTVQALALYERRLAIRGTSGS
jgi:ADP-ribose pyrophosphatase